MDEKINIDAIRNRGGRTDIGTGEDGAIIQMFDVGDRHLILKERSIYEFILADQIDPARTNPKLPNHTQRLVLDRGTESEMVSRTFLTAKGLFGAQFISEAVDIKKAMVIALNTVIELSVLDNEIQSYLSEENRLTEKYNVGKNSASYAIPSLIDIQTRCKTIFQKADHVSQGLMDIIRLFYPQLPPNHYYTQFQKLITDKYGEADPFSVFLKDAIPFLEIIRNTRNCLDHRRTEAEIKDFELQVNGDILTPTFKIDHLNSKVELMPLAQYLTATNANMITIFELMVAHISSKNLKPNAMIRYDLKLVPEKERRNKFIKYCFWSDMGFGGFYHQ